MRRPSRARAIHLRVNSPTRPSSNPAGALLHRANLRSNQDTATALHTEHLRQALRLRKHHMDTSRLHRKDMATLRRAHTALLHQAHTQATARRLLSRDTTRNKATEHHSQLHRFPQHRRHRATSRAREPRKITGPMRKGYARP